jgi:hypothetical protein
MVLNVGDLLILSVSFRSLNRFLMDSSIAASVNIVSFTKWMWSAVDIQRAGESYGAFGRPGMQQFVEYNRIVSND